MEVIEGREGREGREVKEGREGKEGKVKRTVRIGGAHVYYDLRSQRQR